MNRVAEKAVAAQVLVVGFVAGAFDGLRRDERGQGSVEYLGVILVVAAIVLVLIGLAAGWGEAIGAKITEAIDSLGGGGE